MQMLHRAVLLCIAVSICMPLWYSTPGGSIVLLVLSSCVMTTVLMYMWSRLVEIAKAEEAAPFRFQLDDVLETMHDHLNYFTNNAVKLPISEATDFAWLDAEALTSWHTPQRNEKIMRSLGWTREDLCGPGSWVQIKPWKTKIGQGIRPDTSLNPEATSDFRALRDLLSDLPAPDRLDVPLAMIMHWKNPQEERYVYEAVVKGETGIRWIFITLNTKKEHLLHSGELPQCGFLITLDTVKVECRPALLAKVALRTTESAPE